VSQALDSFGRITVTAARAAQDRGYVGWFRYLYNLERAEITHAHAHGLWVALIGEHDTLTHHPIHDGYPTGLNHGRWDGDVADSLGAPRGSVIFATADDKVFSGTGEIIMGQYLDGYRTGLAGRYLTGIYGGAGPIKWAKENGHADVAWCAGASYWHNGVDPRDAHAVAHQLPVPAVNVGGTTCDLNNVFDAGWWGQWSPLGAQPSQQDEEGLAMAGKHWFRGGVVSYVGVDRGGLYRVDFANVPAVQLTTGEPITEVPEALAPTFDAIAVTAVGA
jgi:hypothetical protein